MAIRCSHCKHTTVQSLQHTHSHTHRFHTVNSRATHDTLSQAIRIQSLQSRGDTTRVSVQISTGGKSKKNSLASSFVKKNKGWKVLFLHSLFDHLCVGFFTLVASPQRPSTKTHFRIIPTIWRMTKVRPKEGLKKANLHLWYDGGWKSESVSAVSCTQYSQPSKVRPPSICPMSPQWHLVCNNRGQFGTR